MIDWTDDKSWSDKYLDSVKEILGRLLIGAANAEEDQLHNTDLIVLKMDTVRIACRIRRFTYFSLYNNEFTVRTGRPNGTKTELAKIIEGWGDYLFYAFASPEGPSLHAWTLIDLHPFRLWLSRQLVVNKGEIPGKIIKNTDGSSTFRAFSLANIDPAAIIERSQ
jgi:hypothetical protein